MNYTALDIDEIKTKFYSVVNDGLNAFSTAINNDFYFLTAPQGLIKYGTYNAVFTQSLDSTTNYFDVNFTVNLYANNQNDIDNLLKQFCEVLYNANLTSANYKFLKLKEEFFTSKFIEELNLFAISLIIKINYQKI